MIFLPLQFSSLVHQIADEKFYQKQTIISLVSIMKGLSSEVTVDNHCRSHRIITVAGSVLPSFCFSCLKLTDTLFTVTQNGVGVDHAMIQVPNKMDIRFTSKGGILIW